MRNLLILIFLIGVVNHTEAVLTGYSHSLDRYSVAAVVPDSTVTDDDGILFFDENLSDTIIPLNDENIVYSHEDSIIDSLKRKVEENTIYIQDDSLFMQGDSLLQDEAVQGDSSIIINDSILGRQEILVSDSAKKEPVTPVLSAAEQLAEIERLARIKADSIVKADTAMIDFTKNMKYNDVKRYITLLPEEVKLPSELQAILDRPNLPEGYERYTSYDDTIIVNPLFLPLTFNGNELDSTINFVQNTYKNKPTYQLVDPIPDWLKKGLERDSVNTAVRRYAINYFTSTVKYDARFAPKAPDVKPVEAAGSLQDYVSIQKKELKVDPVATQKVTVNYWTTKMTVCTRQLYV